MSDSGKSMGECEHGRLRGNCYRCLQAENAELKARNERLIVAEQKSYADKRHAEGMVIEGLKERDGLVEELRVAQELAETATAELHRLRSYAEEVDRVTAKTANEFDLLRMEVGTLRAAKADLEEEVKDLRDRLSTVRLYG